ncbi:hypothetical protein ACF044_07775 [Microbacterium sp. NPDC016588]
MRTLPAAAVALPGRRRFGASAVGAGFAATVGAAPAPASSGAPASTAAAAPATLLSVQDTPLAAGRIGVSWTLNPPPHDRGSVR